MRNIRRFPAEAARQGKQLCGRLAIGVVSLRRRRLSGVTFVGVTGSCGKTTAKDLIGAVLASRFAGVVSSGTHNSLRWILPAVLATRRSHRFCVQEIGAAGPDSIDKSIRAFRPDVAVVTTVGQDHYKAFRTLEATAAEKAKLVAAVPPGGTALLNADDPYVLAMRERCVGRVLTYGRSEAADVRAVDVRSDWPDRLSFVALYAGESQPVATRLCGEHWTPCVLAALATGLVLEIPLAESARVVERVEPPPGRMSPVEPAGGVIFMRDDWKAPLWSIPPALEFLRRARAARKIAVIGTLSDYAGANARKYAAVARQALRVADHVVFAGRWARGTLPAADATVPDALRAFVTVDEAARWLRDFLRSGDLVLLKGSRRVDWLERVIRAWTEAQAAPRRRKDREHGSAERPGEAC